MKFVALFGFFFGSGLYIVFPPELMTRLVGRSLLILASMLALVALSLATRVGLDWLAQQLGQPFPRKGTDRR